MTLLEAVRSSELLVFVALASISVLEWRRRRTAASAWLSLTFVVLAAVLVGGRFIPEGPREHGHADTLVRIVVMALAVFPYCLYRFGDSFSGTARGVEPVARSATTLLLLATVLITHFPGPGEAVPGWYIGYTLAFVVDWTALSMIAVACLWRSGRGQPAVARRRMQTLGMAAVVLNVALMIAAGGGPQPSPSTVLWSQLVGLSSAILFLVGFSPPRSLRTIWRRVEVEGLRVAEADLMVVDGTEAIIAIVLPQAIRLLGARGATVLDSSGSVIGSHGMSRAAASQVAARLEVPVPTGASPVVDSDLVAIPLRQGWLAVETSASTPFFGSDELVILETLGHLAGLALDRADLVDRDRAAQRQLAEREAQLAEAQHTALLGSYSWDLVTGHRVWSDEMYRLLGFVPGETVEDIVASFNARIHPDDAAAVAAARERAMTSPDQSTLEYRIVLPDVGVRWLHARIRPVVDGDGRPVKVLGTVQDITERKLTEEAMAFQALHDALTQLPNRAMFLDRLRQALARRSRNASGLAVLFLDLDRFKWLNDSLGHAAGDELLVKVAARLQAALRASDTVARFGGDEFVVLCEDLVCEAEAEALAGRFASVVSGPMVVANEETTVTASIGIAFAPPGTEAYSPESLLRDADSAMYQAKERGRDRSETFDVTTRLRAITRHETANALRRGMDRGELVVHYQPEIDITTGRPVAVEALVRWNHPDRGLLPPAEFITLAEETGLIVRLGAQVLDIACRQVVAWQSDHHGRGVALAVNLAARQLMAPDLCDVVAAALSRSGLDPGLLCLEITESVLLEDATQSARALEQLKTLGVRVGVDDFGTGFSSLTYLKRLPVDTLKIDRSFVQGLGRDRGDWAIVASVVDLAHAFGLTTIAEGVETLEQLGELRKIGCEYGQGYLWSPPLAAAEAGDWLTAHGGRAEPTGADRFPALTEGSEVTGRRRLLIVEDDPSVRALLRMIFESDDGFEVVGEADDGRQGIALSRHFSPDVVLLDLAMPGMGGLEALPLIRAVAPEAEVVVLSGLDPADLGPTAQGQGAATFLTKASDLTELPRLLRPVPAPGSAR